MMKYIIVFFILIYSVPALSEEPPPEEIPCTPEDTRPRCLFDFDENGQVRTRDGIAERTFNFPALKMGFIIDVNHKAILPYGSIEFLDWSMFGEYWNSNIGLSWNRVLVDVSWEIVPIMKIGPTLWGGYNVDENDWAAGIGFNILRF